MSAGCPLLTQAGTLCTLPTRLDVALHYLKSGGRLGLREPMPRLVSRMLTFLRFLFEKEFESMPTMRAVLKSLFSSASYTSAIATVCPNKPVIDPFQVSVIIQLPGQVTACAVSVVPTRAPRVASGDALPRCLPRLLLSAPQAVPMHFDAPWFWGASRFTLPQWLLVGIVPTCCCARV